MKKGKRAVLVLAMLSAFMLTACANASIASASASELVAPETSSEELLVSSLEYLLQESGDEQQRGEEALAETEEAGLTLQVENKPEMPGSDIEVSDAAEPEVVSGEAEETEGTQVTVYYGNSGSLDLKQEVTVIEELTPENLIDSLAKHNIVSLDTKVNSFEEEENTEGKVLKLDLSRGFREYLKTMTETAEKVILASVADTFLEAYEAEFIQITVEGSPLETVDKSYEDPMEFMLPKEE